MPFSHLISNHVFKLLSFAAGWGLRVGDRLQKTNASLFSTFPMVVPSLSWP